MRRRDSLISVVVPVFTEQDVISLTLAELTRVLEESAPNYEIIVVDDGSTDATFAEVEKAHLADNRIKGLRFSRNFGKEAAILAGLSRANGQAVITVDGDLQHPPECIPQMIEKWLQGAQVVNGVKKTREYGGFFHRAMARSFNSIFSRMVGFSIVNSSDFKLLDARVAQLLVQRFPEQQRFHRGLSSWVGFKQNGGV